MKLQPGLRIFHHLLTPLACFKLIWWFSIAVGELLFLATVQFWVSRQCKLRHDWNQILDPQYRLWWLWYLSRTHLHYFEWDISNFWWSFMLIDCRELEEVQFHLLLIEDFSVGQLSIRKCTPRKISIPIYASFLHFVKVPNFLNLWDHKVGSCSELWYHFFCIFCYDQQHVVFLLRYSILLQSYLCVLFEFSYADDCITFNELIQRASSSQFHYSSCLLLLLFAMFCV